MKSHPLITQTIRTHDRSEMIEITEQVRQAVTALKIADGMAIVHVPHTTAAITINENADPDVKHDLLAKLRELIPHVETYYQHDEGNSDSHLKTSMFGNSVTVLIENGQLVLGTWQGIQFCEFDGPRTRHVQIKLVQFAP